MFTTPAYAQAPGGGMGGMELLVQIVPFIIVFAILYFLIIRPQQQRVKNHQAMVAGVRRGDTVITSGGIIGKVAKVLEDDEVLVEVADGVRLRVVKSSLSEVRGKTDPAAAPQVEAPAKKTSKPAANDASDGPEART